MMKVDLKRYKRVNHGKKQPFVYEHSIPASIVDLNYQLQSIIKSSGRFFYLGSVVVILEKRIKLSSIKLARKNAEDGV